jgi:hypothetical protein
MQRWHLQQLLKADGVQERLNKMTLPAHVLCQWCLRSWPAKQQWLVG